MNIREVLLSSTPTDSIRELDTSRKLSVISPSLTKLHMEIPRGGAHHKDVFAHSLQVLDQAISRETGRDIILRTAALFHDIGKPATRKFEGRGKVTFQNHEHVGANMIPKILKNNGYTAQEISNVRSLVLLHMRSHSFTAGWTDSAVRRLETDAGGAKQLERLLVIFTSDVTTKYDKKKAVIEKSISELTEELARVRELDYKKSLRPSLNGHQVAELLSLSQGRELGMAMKFAQLPENIALSESELRELLVAKFL